MNILEKTNDLLAIIRQYFKKNSVSNNEILMELAEVKNQLEHAQLLFNLQTDLDLIESCIYQIDSLEAKYNYLLKEARKHGIKGEVDKLCVVT